MSLVNKATVPELGNLHGLVAMELAKQVQQGDLKAIEKAIAFLKNNNITAEITETKETKDLFVSVSELVQEGKVRPDSKDAVESILEMYQ